MFGLFKRDPMKKLEKQYKEIMEEARDIQRSGDLRAYAKKLEEAEVVVKKMDALKP